MEAVRLRYGAAPVPCRVVERRGWAWSSSFGEPAHAVAPGQLACLMSGRPRGELRHDRRSRMTAGARAHRPRRAAGRGLPARGAADHRRDRRARGLRASRRSTTFSWRWSACSPRPGPRAPCTLAFEVGEEAIRTRVGPLDEPALARRAPDGDGDVPLTQAHAAADPADGGGLVRRGGRGRRPRSSCGSTSGSAGT